MTTQQTNILKYFDIQSFPKIYVEKLINIVDK